LINIRHLDSFTAHEKRDFNFKVIVPLREIVEKQLVKQAPYGEAAKYHRTPQAKQ